MLDITNNIKTVRLDSATVTATGNQTEILDVLGFQGDVCFHLDWTGATADAVGNNLKITVMEGNASNLSDAVEVTDDDRYSKKLSITSAASAGSRLGFIIGVKRYLRLRYTETGTASVPLRSIAILGAPRHAPVV